MKQSELVIGKIYFSEWLKTTVEYCGVQTYKGEKHHNFWEPGIGLSYWLNLQEVSHLTPRALDSGESTAFTICTHGKLASDCEEHSSDPRRR